MRQRELEAFGDELLDVWPPQVSRLLELDQLKDLPEISTAQQSQDENERGST